MFFLPFAIKQRHIKPITTAIGAKAVSKEHHHRIKFKAVTTMSSGILNIIGNPTNTTISVNNIKDISAILLLITLYQLENIFVRNGVVAGYKPYPVYVFRPTKGIILFIF
jgi:hypothetical protein